jgi:hypothetical protein
LIYFLALSTQKGMVVNAILSTTGNKYPRPKKDPKMANQLRAVDKYLNEQFKTDADKVVKDIDDKLAELFVSL